jgi:hypothetical protein
VSNVLPTPRGDPMARRTGSAPPFSPASAGRAVKNTDVNVDTGAGGSCKEE